VFTDNRQVVPDAAAASAVVYRLMRDYAMAISCDEHLQKLRTTARASFAKCPRKMVLRCTAESWPFLRTTDVKLGAARTGANFKEISMVRWISAAVLTVSLMLGGDAAIDLATAAPAQRKMQKPVTSGTTDVSARRHHQHAHHYTYHPYYPYAYYDRPRYYSPGPFLLLPPSFGYGWEPW
jgi:hypothetical protein